MFSVSFGEMAMVAAVGLIIIGPERLPQTARFLGHLVGKIQRQISGVRSDIRREMELEDLKQINRDYQKTVRETHRAVASAAEWPSIKQESDGGDSPADSRRDDA